MATVSRRPWSEVREEFIRGARGANYSAWPSRADYLIWEAYLDICCLYHHPQLEQFSTQNLAEGTNVISYPDDCVIAMAVAELQRIDLPAEVDVVEREVRPRAKPRLVRRRKFFSKQDEEQPVLYLEHVHTAVWAGSFSTVEDGQPQQFSNFKRQIYFDKFSDADRRYRIFYLRFPRRPDMESSDTYPEIGEQWDGHIIELALYKAGVRTGNDPVAERNAKLFMEFAQQQPQPRVVESTVPNRPEMILTNKPQGGLST